MSVRPATVAPTLKMTFTGLTTNTLYYFKVRAGVNEVRNLGII